MTKPAEAHWLIVLALAAAIVVSLLAIFTRTAAAGGDAEPPRARVRMSPGSPSCLMNALQLGYQTGRRELAYAASEACARFAGSRGFAVPYGHYGPYVPTGWVPDYWALPAFRN